MIQECCYWIGPAPSEDSVVWERVVQTPQSARRSLDGSLVLLKWTGAKPGGVPSGGTTYSPGPMHHTHGTIESLSSIVNGPSWTNESDSID